MKTKIIINGKAVDAVLDDEQAKAALETKHTGLEHPGYEGVIYNINGGQCADNTRETLTPLEFSDKQVRDDHIRALEIYRRLLLAAAELNNAPIDRFGTNANYWYICYTTEDGLYVEWEKDFSCLSVYFQSKKAAQKAIDIVGKDDLIWLLRDFQPYIGAYKPEE